MLPRYLDTPPHKAGALPLPIGKKGTGDLLQQVIGNFPVGRACGSAFWNGADVGPWPNKGVGLGRDDPRRFLGQPQSASHFRRNCHGIRRIEWRCMRHRHHKDFDCASPPQNRKGKHDNRAVLGAFFAAAPMLFGPEIGIANDGAALRCRQPHLRPLAVVRISARKRSGVFAAMKAC